MGLAAAHLYTPCSTPPHTHTVWSGEGYRISDICCTLLPCFKKRISARHVSPKIAHWPEARGIFINHVPICQGFCKNTKQMDFTLHWRSGGFCTAQVKTFRPTMAVYLLCLFHLFGPHFSCLKAAYIRQ